MDSKSVKLYCLLFQNGTVLIGEVCERPGRRAALPEQMWFSLSRVMMMIHTQKLIQTNRVHHHHPVTLFWVMRRQTQEARRLLLRRRSGGVWNTRLVLELIWVEHSLVVVVYERGENRARRRSKAEKTRPGRRRYVIRVVEVVLSIWIH